MNGYDLTPEGRKVLAVLMRQPSGYGREQLLIVALRLACRKIEGAPTEGPELARWADSLVLAFLQRAERSLSDTDA